MVVNGGSGSNVVGKGCEVKRKAGEWRLWHREECRQSVNQSTSTAGSNGREAPTLLCFGLTIMAEWCAAEAHWRDWSCRRRNIWKWRSGVRGKATAAGEAMPGNVSETAVRILSLRFNPSAAPGLL